MLRLSSSQSNSSPAGYGRRNRASRKPPDSARTREQSKTPRPEERNRVETSEWLNELGTVTFATSSGSACVVQLSQQIPLTLRCRSFAGQSEDFRYYAIAGETLEGQFEHRYVILKNGQTGELALQPIFLANQDILDGLPPGKLRAALSFPRRFFPGWLRMSMLVAGCSAGEGALDCSEPWAVDALQEVLETYARRTRAAIVLLKDFPAVYRPALARFTRGGYRRVPSMPGCVLDLAFSSFEEFMSARLGRNLRYKYRKLSKQAPIPFEVVTDVTPIAKEICALYLQTYGRSKMRFEQLTPEFFARIGREVPDRARFFLWRVEDRLVAFALCLVHDGTMKQLNIGFDYSVSLELKLYYVTMRDLLRWALERGLTRFETGRLNYDPKLRFRMKLAPLDLYARHTSTWLNPLFKRAVGFLQPVRHDPLIRQFPNANEL